MTHDELAAQCRKQIELAGEGASVSLVMRGRWGKLAAKRLWPGGPWGQIVSEEMRNGHAAVVVLAPAREVLAALEAAGVRA